MNASNKRRALAGLIFIALGAALLASLFNLTLLGLRIPHIIFSWKVILILIGFVLLISDKNRSTGIILIGVGTFFLLQDYLNLDWSFMIKLAIPAVLVLIGISLLFPRKYGRKRDGLPPQSEHSANVLDDVNIFSGGNKFVTADAFSGGQVTCIFGGAELNFRDSTLAQGENVIDLTCIFGGCTLFVPEDWTVRVDATAIFGGFSDERYKRNPQLLKDPEKVLVIKGVVIFGGGEIKIA